MNPKKMISYALVILLFSFLFWKIIDGFDQIKSVQWKLQPKNLIPLLLVLLPGPFINAFSWHLITKALGGNIGLLENVKVWTFSNATRFLPGSVWQYAGRVYMLSQKGASKTFTTTAILLEAIFNLAVGSAIVLLVLNFWPLSIPFFVKKALLPFIFLALLAMIFLTGSRVVLLETAFKETLKSDIIKLSKIKIRWLLPIMLSVLTQFILAGLSLFFISASVINLSLNSAIFFIGICAASWLVGYLTFLAPSGLGVREASIAGLLTFYVPLSLGGLIAILFRLTSTISEAMTVLIIFLLTKNKLS